MKLFNKHKTKTIYISNCQKCGAPLPEYDFKCAYCGTMNYANSIIVGCKVKITASYLVEYYRDEIGIITDIIEKPFDKFNIEVTFDRPDKPFIEYFTSDELMIV